MQSSTSSSVRFLEGVDGGVFVAFFFFGLLHFSSEGDVSSITTSLFSVRDIFQVNNHSRRKKPLLGLPPRLSMGFTDRRG